MQQNVRQKEPAHHDYGNREEAEEHHGKDAEPERHSHRNDGELHDYGEGFDHIVLLLTRIGSTTQTTSPACGELPSTTLMVEPEASP